MWIYKFLSHTMQLGYFYIYTCTGCLVEIASNLDDKSHQLTIYVRRFFCDVQSCMGILNCWLFITSGLIGLFIHLTQNTCFEWFWQENVPSLRYVYSDHLKEKWYLLLCCFSILYKSTQVSNMAFYIYSLLLFSL